MQYNVKSTFILCNLHVNVYIKDLNALRILMNFLCIYSDERGGGGFAQMHVYVWEHIASLYYRTA